MESRIEIHLCSSYQEHQMQCNGRCGKLHTCRRWLGGGCEQVQCGQAHSLLTSHNRKVFHRLLIEIKECDQAFRYIVRRMLPNVCHFYSVRGYCHEGAHCRKLHLCKWFILGSCPTIPGRCKYSHDVHEQCNLRILKPFGYNRNNASDVLPDILVRDSDKILPTVCTCDQCPVPPNRKPNRSNARSTTAHTTRTVQLDRDEAEADSSDSKFSEQKSQTVDTTRFVQDRDEAEAEAEKAGSSNLKHEQKLQTSSIGQKTERDAAVIANGGAEAEAEAEAEAKAKADTSASPDAGGSEEMDQNEKLPFICERFLRGVCDHSDEECQFHHMEEPVCWLFRLPRGMGETPSSPVSSSESYNNLEEIGDEMLDNLVNWPSRQVALDGDIWLAFEADYSRLIERSFRNPSKTSFVRYVPLEEGHPFALSTKIEFNLVRTPEDTHLMITRLKLHAQNAEKITLSRTIETTVRCLRTKSYAELPAFCKPTRWVWYFRRTRERLADVDQRSASNGDSDSDGDWVVCADLIGAEYADELEIRFLKNEPLRVQTKLSTFSQVALGKRDVDKDDTKIELEFDFNTMVLTCLSNQITFLTEILSRPEPLKEVTS